MRTVTVLVLGGAVVLALVGGGVYLLTVRPDDEPRTSATHWERYDDRGRVLRVHYRGSACQEDASADVDEARRRVVVTVRATVAAGSCRQQVVRRSLTVRLDRPLRGRKVVDGACLRSEPRHSCERPHRRVRR